ncbi:hypothetical protein BDB01DRAFT_804790 [Pilobolus umbonatus]|nr:hypothetical protein BDB01DRAFT_804790 [Pilobolus umbonatus]
MSKVVIDSIDRTEEYIHFMNKLKQFHDSKGTTVLLEPVVGGKKIDLYQFYKAVMIAGGYEKVTKKRKWRQIGDIFEFPETCTNSAYILKGLYIRNLLGWEEEQVWCKEWIAPEELKGPEAHKVSTLAGKAYKKCKHHHHEESISPAPTLHHRTFILPNTQNTSKHTIFPFHSITTSETHKCEISELHHLTQPIEHIHSNEVDNNRDCITGNEFNEDSKIRVISALHSNNTIEVDLALNNIVTISFECPHKLLMTEHPSVLDLLIKKAGECIHSTLFEEEIDPSHHILLLKILHIIRNFSFIEMNSRLFATNTELKQVLIKCLVLKDSSHYGHCIDILENMSPFLELGPFDAIIGCLNSLLMNVNDRTVILGSIRVLTMVAYTSAFNYHFLSPTSTQIASRLTQFLIADDEVLIGTIVEYLYQYARQSTLFSQYLLNLHDGADIGILVSLLMTPCKYFRPLLIHADDPIPPTGSSSPTDSTIFTHQHHGSVPCELNVTSYRDLDEPYRCLGWLKDRFELSTSPGGSYELPLKDIYLLYEMLYSHAKPLKMKDVYTVLKIAFPSATETLCASSDSLENIVFQGLQIKLGVIEDGSELVCEWTDCSQSFEDIQLFQSHVLHDHISSNQGSCKWTNCDNGSFSNRNELTFHIQNSHLPFYMDTSEIEGVSLVAAKLLEVLSRNPNSHVAFMPYEEELVNMSKKRPKLLPFIEDMFSNFQMGSCSTHSL